MKVKYFTSVLAALLCTASIAWSQEENEAQPPAPGDEAPPAARDDQPPAPADADSPSDQRPQLNGRTTRGYAGQAPSKQAPWQQGPQQAPSKEAPMAQGPVQGPHKQAPMAQGPMQAPGKGAGYFGGQGHTVGYAPCAGCQVQTYAAPANRTYYSQTASRRGLFRGRYR